MNPLGHLLETDPEIYKSVRKELLRQAEGIELIASENFVSRAILETVGTVLTNKYAEGMPGRRYYGGCEEVDVAERIAEDRARELFGAEYANVQPHSGSQANMAVFMSALQPGDTVLAMDLDAGGHLTHGSPVNFSDRLYNFIPYGVNEETEQLDYDEIRSMALEHKRGDYCGCKLTHVFLISSVFQTSRRKSMPSFWWMAHIAGLVAAGFIQARCRMPIT